MTDCMVVRYAVFWNQAVSSRQEAGGRKPEAGGQGLKRKSICDIHYITIISKWERLSREMLGGKVDSLLD